MAKRQDVKANQAARQFPHGAELFVAEPWRVAQTAQDGIHGGRVFDPGLALDAALDATCLGSGQRFLEGQGRGQGAAQPEQAAPSGQLLAAIVNRVGLEMPGGAEPTQALKPRLHFLAVVQAKLGFMLDAHGVHQKIQSTTGARARRYQAKGRRVRRPSRAMKPLIAIQAETKDTAKPTPRIRRSSGLNSRQLFSRS